MKGFKIFCFASLLVCCSCSKKTENGDDSLYLFVSAAGKPEQECIKVYRFDQEEGSAVYVSGLSGISNPTFIYPSPDKKFVYAVGEDQAPDIPSANTLAFNAENGTLTLLNSQINQGDCPCNIILSPDGQYVYTSNYFGENINEYHVDSQGLLEPGRAIGFEGSSIDPERQTHPYIHAANFTRDGKFLLIDDLGTDRIHIFPTPGPVSLDNMKDLEIPAGVGPRHLCFNAEGDRAYLLGELSGDVVTISYNAEAADFNVIQTLRCDSLGAGGSADVHISPDGRFVYTSHRLKGDGISILAVNPEDGTLTKVGYQDTGIHPRNFAISPNGKFLLVACRDTNEVQIFARDVESGLLTNTGNKIEMERPMCVQF